MTNKQKILSCKGQFMGVTISSPAKLSARFKGLNLVKKSSFVARAGVAYDNIGNVIQARADGTLPSENAGLPWGVWKQFPYIISHNGNDYFRFSLVNDNPIVTKYYLDGKEITKAEAKTYCIPSAFENKTEKPVVITVKENNIEEIR